jgi:hypothetical protein
MLTTAILASVTAIWNEFLTKLDNLKHLFSADANADLSKLTLKSLVGNNAAAVILRFEDGGGKLADRIGKGFFHSSSIPITHDYANSDDPNTLMNDQFKKLNEEAQLGGQWDVFSGLGNDDAGVSDALFKNLLVWADLCMTPRLGVDILPKTSKSVYPNIIDADGV